MECAREKRRFSRIEESVCAWVTFRKDSAAYGTLTMDLGVEGARFSTLKNVNVGEHVLVFLQLPSMTIECKGKVCWTEASSGGPASFGVRFIDLREPERDCLCNFLNQYSPAVV